MPVTGCVQPYLQMVDPVILPGQEVTQCLPGCRISTTTAAAPAPAAAAGPWPLLRLLLLLLLLLLFVFLLGCLAAFRWPWWRCAGGSCVCAAAAAAVGALRSVNNSSCSTWFAHTSLGQQSSKLG
jgi:hypothetical protein